MIELDDPAPRKAKPIRERDVEAHLVERVEALGGTCEKFTSPARRSVPDRLVCWPESASWATVQAPARVQFVECKAPGEKPTPAQARDHERRRAMGFVVWVADTFESVDDFLEEYGP